MRPDIARYERNLREELDGSALYAALAAAEVDPTRKDLFLQLSQAEAGHAQLWREKLTAAGVDAERFTPSLRTRVLARLAQRFGPRFGVCQSDACSLPASKIGTVREGRIHVTNR